MRKILLIASLFCFIATSTIKAQVSTQQTILSHFPFQHFSEVEKDMLAIQKWSKSDWNPILNMLDDDSLKLAATYLIDAVVHNSNGIEKNNLTEILGSGIKQAKTQYAKDLLIKELGLMGVENAIQYLSPLLKDENYCGQASRALATNSQTQLALQALRKALAKASSTTKPHIQEAISYIYKPVITSNLTAQKPKDISNATQKLLKIQDQLVVASNPLQKAKLLAQIAQIPGFPSFMLVSKFLDDNLLQHEAALIVTRLALADNSTRGKTVRSILEKALPLIKGQDSAILVSKLVVCLKTMPYDFGFEPMFNGKDLSGWKGLVENPIARSKMKPEVLAAAQEKANEKLKTDWIVKDGLLVFSGHGDNLATEKQYGDFEMYVDWKITEKGDAGIYLRGTPQVQIWDTSRREVGAQVGSGGLYNNQTNASKPLLVADNAVGQWNTFYIVMRGEKVTVYLNGKKTVDNVTLENYWDRKLPIFIKEQIELQAHGTYVAYRNLYIKELPGNDTIQKLTIEEVQQGFKLLFDGSGLDNWQGNTTSYQVREGNIMVIPDGGSGGNLYTKEEFSNFELHFEFQLTPGANNGLGIRTPTTGDAAYVGMELQILDNESPKYSSLNPYQYHGSVYGVIPAKRGYLKPTGEWNQEVVIAKGSLIKVILNGETIMEGDIKKASKDGTMDHNQHPGLLNKTGHIGFLGHGDVVRFRNIKIKNL
jgi:Domain of Unknown Function (DUF1080)